MKLNHKNNIKINKFSALQHRDFRLLWIGQLISNTGSQMQIVALNWHIYLLTNSAVALGLIGLSRFIPVVIFSLIGGSFADSHNRKKIMFYSQSIMAIFSIILTIATFTNNVTPLIIYSITIGSFIAFSFDLPARQALIPSLINKKDFTNAMSLNSIMFQISAILGPGLVGFVIAEFGIGSVYAFNSLSFMAVIIALLLMRSDGAINGKSTPVSITSILEGLRFVASRTIIWSTMLLDFFGTFFSSATALLPIFAKDILHVGPRELGFLYAGPAIGALIAGYIIAHMEKINNQGRILIYGVICYGFATMLFGLSTFFWLSFISLIILGIGDAISAIIRNIARQLETPDYIRGRMIAINMIFFLGGPQLGEFEAGILAANVGAPVSVVIGGISTVIFAGIIALKIPDLINYKGHENKQ
ncbi:MFS transporter [Candidatus Levyibacteriota bacterium]|nr:MFS transporter [Candidatus Levybacteria bacterium]MSU26003.1 MFS transporter [Candidatus Levybacteria bacterium]GDX62057.1 MFS transporter [Candidatus Levybacteria bacterium]